MRNNYAANLKGRGGRGCKGETTRLQTGPLVVSDGNHFTSEQAQLPLLFKGTSHLISSLPLTGGECAAESVTTA